MNEDVKIRGYSNNPFEKEDIDKVYSILRKLGTKKNRVKSIVKCQVCGNIFLSSRKTCHTCQNCNESYRIYFISFNDVRRINFFNLIGV